MNMQSIDATRHHVFAGQMQVGAGSEVLTALLGSCIGIGMIWRNGRRCGLAHCLLPETGAPQADAGARYVSEAVPGLLRALGVRRDQYDEVEVVVAGGASMLAALRGTEPIGRRNVTAAREHLTRRGLRVSFQDVGGHQGRRISIDCDSQRYSVVGIGAPTGALQ